MRRPDRAWTRVEGEQGRRTNWYDGKTFTHLDLGANAYATWPAPATTDELLDKMKEKLGFMPPLSNLMRQNIEKEVFKNIQTGFYVGEAVVHGTRAATWPSRRRTSTGRSGSTTWSP